MEESDRKIFSYVKDSDSKSIDWSKPDYTGANADYYLQKYTDRPEDAGNLEGFQKALSDMGVVVPPADALNAAIYALQGEWGDAALSTAAILPVIGEMKNIKKLAQKSGEKMVTVYRGYPKWFPGSMVKKGKFISGESPTSLRASREGLGYEFYTSMDRNVGDMYAGKQFIKSGNKKGVVLEFNVPESWFRKNARTHIPVDELINKGGKTIFGDNATARFADGLPKQFLTKVHGKVKREPLTPLQEKLLKLKNNPNIGANLNRVILDNIKRHKPRRK